PDHPLTDLLGAIYDGAQWPRDDQEEPVWWAGVAHGGPLWLSVSVGMMDHPAGFIGEVFHRGNHVPPVCPLPPIFPIKKFGEKNPGESQYSNNNDDPPPPPTCCHQCQ